MKTSIIQFTYSKTSARTGVLGVFMLALLLFFAGSAGQVLASQEERGLSINLDRGEEPGKRVETGGERILLYRESHALVVGMSHYTAGWPNLPGVQKDVDIVTQVLETQGFHVVVQMDLTRSELDQTFIDFITRYGQNPENRLLFYFAGHGHTLETNYGSELGYIVPVDAPNPHTDPANFKAKALDMQQIAIYAMQIEAKHALFLFDACFSGSLFALSRAVPQAINYKTAEPVRQFITSGSAEETVPDESIFREQFVRALTEGEADSDQDGYITGTELGEFLQNTVVNYSQNMQHPQYGKIRHPNLDKGDFVFLLPTQPQEEPSQVSQPSENTFSIDDLTKAAEQEKAMKAWQAKLDEMEGAFSFVSQYEQDDISQDLKIEAWQRFVEAFSEDNPFSSRDEELLELAQEKIHYWENFTPPTPTATPVPEVVFRLENVVVKDSNGRVMRPEENVYLIPQGETVTITANVTHSQGHEIEFAWTTARGKVPPNSDNTNTYTATKTGSDYVIVYIWDAVTGQELPEYPINITVVPAIEPAIDAFMIEDVLVVDASGKIVEPQDDIYHIKRGETVIITVQVAGAEEEALTYAWTTGNGKVPVSDSNVNTYTATTPGGDYIIVYVWNTATGEELEFPVNLTVVP